MTDADRSPDSPPHAVCPACRACVPTFTTHDDPRPRYCGHLRATGWRPNRVCEMGGEKVSPNPNTTTQERP